MLHEEVNREEIQLGAKVANLTAREIKKALDKLLAQLNELKKGNQKLPTVVHGKQSLKELSAQNAGLSSMELKDPNLRLLNREMKKAGIDFAPKKTGKGEYLLFFKGRDADTMTHAFNQYTKKLVKQAEKPSIRKVLSDFKEKAAAMNAQRAVTKNKDKGIEL